jgi:GNAT superfamily N-acetyltransferase
LPSHAAFSSAAGFSLHPARCSIKQHPVMSDANDLDNTVRSNPVDHDVPRPADPLLLPVDEATPQPKRVQPNARDVGDSAGASPSRQRSQKAEHGPLQQVIPLSRFPGPIRGHSEARFGRCRPRRQKGGDNSTPFGVAGQSRPETVHGNVMQSLTVLRRCDRHIAPRRDVPIRAPDHFGDLTLNRQWAGGAEPVVPSPRVAQSAGRDVAHQPGLRQRDGVIVGYVALSAAQIERAYLPKSAQRNRPDAIPAILLGQLAIDRRYHGKGYARSLMLYALTTAVRLSKEIGCFGVLTHPIDHGVRDFYRRFGFEDQPFDPGCSMIVRIADLEENGF